jgi:hypothetical protein
MNPAILWGIIAILAVLGGWRSYAAARRSGKGPLVGYLVGFLVTIVVIVVLSMVVTLLLPR